MRLKIDSQFNLMAGDRDVVFFAIDGNERALARPLVFERVAEGILPQPTIGAGGVITGTEFLQAALNHAWEIGLRPAGFGDTVNQVSALKDHLSDMRALVFREHLTPKP